MIKAHLLSRSMVLMDGRLVTCLLFAVFWLTAFFVSLEPSSVPIRITDTENDCQNDVQFSFTGFSVVGEVISRRANSCKNHVSELRGPVGVELSLVSAASNAPLQNSVSTESGTFVFDNVFPGKYKVLANHKSWKVHPVEQEVQVHLASAFLEQPFSVDGYSISGKVFSGKSQSPVAGAEVFLYSNKEDNHVLSCDPLPSGSKTPLSQGMEPKCYSRTNEDGLFKFKNLPCSSVTLSSRFTKSSAGGSTAYDVSPGTISVEVSNADVNLGNAFEATGFSLSGKVVHSDGTGVSNASILVNGEERTQTDSNGEYTLTKLTPGSYIISAKKQHYSFSEIAKADLSIGATTLPRMHVLKVDVCGRVELGLSGKNREVTVESLSGKQSTYAFGLSCCVLIII
jgi:protocatechuate 3,4-dioxygenase beta subunit